MVTNRLNKHGDWARLSWDRVILPTNPRCWDARGTGSTGPLLIRLTCDRMRDSFEHGRGRYRNGASAVGTDDSAVEALRQTCSGPNEASSIDHDGGA